MIKQAVILAAGRGKRMRENSNNAELMSMPKPLLNVKGRPMIEGKIKKLAERGIDICIVINREYEQIFRSKLKDYNISYRYQDEPLGTANALYAAKDFVKEDLFLVLMGDDIVEYEVDMMISSTKPVVFGFSVNDVTNYGVIIANKRGYVDEIIEKQRSGKGVVNTGVYIMPRKFFEYYGEIKAIAMENGTEIGLTDVPEVLSRHKMKFKLMMLDKWYGVNTPDDLLKVNKLQI